MKFRSKVSGGSSALKGFTASMKVIDKVDAKSISDQKMNGEVFHVVEYCEDGFYYKTKRNGRLSAFVSKWDYLHCKLEDKQCDLCKRNGYNGSILKRSDCYLWNKPIYSSRNSSKLRDAESKNDWLYTEDKSLLCVSCWNKVKPIVKMISLADEIERLTNKLERTRRHVEHHQEIR